jgi:hypothetical protein
MYPNWIQRNLISSDILNNKFLKIGFSQNGEDDFIRSFFWQKILDGEPGTYIDIGCYHESLYSNTKLLSLAGWSGVAVDANPDMCQIWQAQRPLDQVINMAVKNHLDGADFVKFYRFADGAINTTDMAKAKEWQTKGFRFLDRIDVRAVSILDLAGLIMQGSDKIPDFVNIDIEFADYLDQLPCFLDILRHPSLLCVEWITPNMSLPNYRDSKEYRMLSSKGYEIVALIGGNIFAEFKSGR